MLRHGAMPHSNPRPRLERVPERFATAIEWVACVGAAVFLAAFFAVALRRAGYPFDLEWMEGSMVQHVERVLSGKPLYGPPSLDFIAFAYPPLYYYVSALAAHVLGLGFLPLRLVSLICAAVVFCLIYRLAQQETRSHLAGVLAAGLFAATYRVGGAWLDVARNDSLCLALMLAGIYLIRVRRTWAGWAWAGLCLALAALTKQTALLMTVPLLLYVTVVDWRRAVLLLAIFIGALGGATWVLNVTTHGWYAYYVFDLPRHIQEVGALRFPFWTHDIGGRTLIAAVLTCATLLAVLMERNRRSAFWLAVLVSGVSAAWIGRLHVGAYDNVAMPAYVCLALFAGMAGPIVSERLPTSARALARGAIGALFVIQLFHLRYSISQQTPSPHDVYLAHRFARLVGQAGGEVFVPQHSFIPTPAGPIMHAHSWAVTDVLRAGGSASADALKAEIASALQHGRFRMIVLDQIDPWMKPELDVNYQEVGLALGFDTLWTKTGTLTTPQWIFVPRTPSERTRGPSER